MNPPRKTLWRYLREGIYGVYNSVYAVTTWGQSFIFGGGSAYGSTDFAKNSTNKFRPSSMTPAQLSLSLPLLVAQCRQLERTAPWARAVCDSLPAELVGTGIDLMPMTGDDDLNEELHREFHLWAEHALADGGSLWEWQRLVARDLVTSGAGLARIAVLPERVEKGWLPLALIPLEVEWLSYQMVKDIQPNNAFVRGIEFDRLGRPVRFHLRHPQAFIGGECVEESEVIHCFERRRAQQTHGEPILAPVVERMLQDGKLVEGELAAALATTAPAAMIKSESAAAYPDSADSEEGDRFYDIQAGSVARLLPGEDIEVIDNKRATQDIKPFRDTIRQDVASACRTSLFYLDRDPARANYSSLRMDQLIGKRAMIGLKETIGRSCAGKVYEALLPYIAVKLGRKLTPEMYQYELRPDEPEYVDPYRDVQASILAISAGLSTYEIELSSRGKDRDQIFQTLALEKKKLAELGLGFPSSATASSTPSMNDQSTDEEAQPNSADEDTEESQKKARRKRRWLDGY